MACHFARGVDGRRTSSATSSARATGPTRGRDGNMHFGVARAQRLPARLDARRRSCPVTVGAALAFKRRSEPRVALTFFGDGTMSTGDVHEGLNLAAVLQGAGRLRAAEQRLRVLDADRAARWPTPNMAERVRGGWGIPAERVDGTRRARASTSSVLGAIERARAGDGPAGGRGAHAADARPRGARRRPLHGPGAAADVRGRASTPSSGWRRACGSTGCGSTRSTRCAQAAADEVARGLAEAEAAPAPDPATLADGVYAMPPEGT